MQLSRTLIVALVVVAVAASSFAAGLNLGSDAAASEWDKILTAERERIRQLESELTIKQSELDSALSNVDRLERLLSEARKMLSESEERASTIQASLANELERLRRMDAELSKRVADLEGRLQRISSQVSVVSKSIPILNQLRGVDALGPDRNATLNYWLDIKGLVASFDPALTPSVDRVINNVDGLMDYYEWIESYPGENAPAEAIVQWIQSLPPSYQQYVNAVNQFLDEVLTSVASKLSALRDNLS